MKKIIAIAFVALFATGCEAEINDIQGNKNLDRLTSQLEDKKTFLLIDTDERGEIKRYVDTKLGIACYRYYGGANSAAGLSCVRFGGTQ